MRLPTILSEYREGSDNVPAYAWPGDYAVAYLMDDGEFLCAECVNDPTNPVHDDGNNDGWKVVGFMTADYREDEDWVCAHCTVVIDGGED